MKRRLTNVENTHLKDDSSITSSAVTFPTSANDSKDNPSPPTTSSLLGATTDTPAASPKVSSVTGSNGENTDSPTLSEESTSCTPSTNNPSILPPNHTLTVIRSKLEDKIEQHFPSNNITVGLSTPNQVHIQFPCPPKTALIIKLWKNFKTAKALQEVANWLKQYNINIKVEKSVKQEEGMEHFEAINEKCPSEGIDFCVVIGGDGTLLHLNSLFQEHKSVPPVVPLAMGSLGFLLPYPFHSYKTFISRVMDGAPSSVILRTRLKCSVFDPSKSKKDPQFTYQCLNELLVTRTSDSPNLNKLEFYVDDQLATLIQADGIIISSPTGSTAYSLSAGGMMMPPQVPGIAVTPICPHSLSFRPLVLPDCSRLKIRVPVDDRVKVKVSFDGRNPRDLGPEHYVEVTVSPWPLPTFALRSPIVEWFRSIESRLHWNVREIQKPLPDDDLNNNSAGYALSESETFENNCNIFT